MSNLPPMPLLRRLAQEARQFEPPAAALDKAARCYADFLSCALEAADLPWSRQALALCAGRDGPARVVGEVGGYAAEDAAFANAVRGHGLVREDMHTGSISHMGVVIWPVLMAFAPDAGASSGTALRAAVAGYEIGGRVGRCLITPEVARLMRPTGVIGPLSGALAGALLLGLSEDETVNALALAANCASGLNEWPHTGADDMYFHPGTAARDAVTAVRLAALGARGSETALEGPAGLGAAILRAPLSAPVRLFPDGDCEIMSVFNKEVPACNFAQSPCQATLDIRADLAPGEEIAAIHVTTYGAALNYPGCAHKGPYASPLQAKMSIAFGVAAVLARGEIAEANYARLADPDILALVDRIAFTTADDLDAAYPRRQGVRIAVETGAGRRIEAAMDDVRFATPELIRDRLADSAGRRLGAKQATDLTALVGRLSEPLDFSAVVALSAQTEPVS